MVLSLLGHRGQPCQVQRLQENQVTNTLGPETGDRSGRIELNHSRSFLLKSDQQVDHTWKIELNVVTKVAETVGDCQIK